MRINSHPTPPPLFDEYASRSTVLDYLTRHLGADANANTRLDAYIGLLHDWQKRLNLVGKASLPHLWQRHILDSAQLLTHFWDKRGGRIMDIGSGAGFPGMVLAILIAGTTPVILVEANGRKCRFLETVAKQCGVLVDIIHGRIEDLPPMQPSVITARAVAPLAKLFAWTQKQHHADLLCLFMKGKHSTAELTAAQQYATIQTTMLASITHADGVIVTCRGFASQHHKRTP